MKRTKDTVSLPVFLKGDESEPIGEAFATPNPFLGGVTVGIEINPTFNTSGMYNHLMASEMNVAVAPSRLNMHVKDSRTGEPITSVIQLRGYDEREKAKLLEG